eukprot:scaffold141319_cov21-Tisochrysis_lutea.AAC.2
MMQILYQRGVTIVWDSKVIYLKNAWMSPDQKSFIYIKNTVLHIQNAQVASRGVPVKEQSNFGVQARCRF